MWKNSLKCCGVSLKLKRLLEPYETRERWIERLKERVAGALIFEVKS